jgi:hypothetical protein
MKCFLVLFLTLTVAQAFVVSRQTAGSSSSLSMAPKYDKTTQKWSVSKAEEGPEAGYPPSRTLLLHGPKPYFQRIFTPDDYEQAVLKFMSGDKCSRDEAQGNMDAYLRSKFARRCNGTRGVELFCFKYSYVILEVLLTRVFFYSLRPRRLGLQPHG